MAYSSRYQPETLDRDAVDAAPGPGCWSSAPTGAATAVPPSR